jgi:hypothetical protein
MNIKILDTFRFEAKEFPYNVLSKGETMVSLETMTADRDYWRKETVKLQSEVDKLKLQLEEQQKKCDRLYLGVLGWFGFWRDKLPAEAAPSFHHAVDGAMSEKRKHETEGR